MIKVPKSYRMHRFMKAMYLYTLEPTVSPLLQFGQTPAHRARASLLLYLYTLEPTVSPLLQFGQTPAHRASVLGCPSSLSVLIHYAANLSIEDNDGYTPVDLARLMCKTPCYDIGCDVKKAYSLPPTPPPYSGA